MAKQGKEKEIEKVMAEEKEVTPEAEAKSELDTLKEENQALNDKLLRQAAEFDNFKKRTAKEKEEIGGFIKALCLKDILNVLDNFERALQSDCADEGFKKGMEMIFNQLTESLKAQGLEEIEALNCVFNPELHNAVNQVEDESFGENTVCNVMQKGYKIGDKIVRYAMVTVANP